MPGLTRICALQGHEERVWCVSWRPCADPPQLVSVGADRIIRFWGLKAGSALDSENGWVLLGEADACDHHSRTLRSLTWSPDGKIAAVSSFDATVSLWKEGAGENEEPSGGLQFQCVGIVKGHENEVKDAAFSPTGEYFATCSRDKSVWIYEVEDKNFEYECVALLQSHTQDVKCVRWHPSQDVLFSCSYDDTVKIWGPDGDDWSCKETLQAHENTVWNLSFDAEGARFATCSADSTVKIWAPSDQTTTPPPPEAPKSIFSSIGAASLVAPLFRTVAGYAAPAGPSIAPSAAGQKPKAPADASCQWTCVATIQGIHTRAVYAVDWMQFGDTSDRIALATACGDDHVRVFEPVDGSSLSAWRCVGDVEAHYGDANSVAWCPKQLSTGAAVLASAGDDCEIVLWRYES